MVCLPTYNERENLEPMLRALGEVLGPADRVLVIDDNSPDGTGELADRLAAELPFVDVLHRERKDGLGRAYLAGFRVALERGAELVLEMDCDFSHDPHDVPRLIAAATEADLVLGSRGYMFQIETTFRARRAGFRVIEIPITFADREVGGSKMSRGIVLEAIWKVPALRLAALRGRV